MTFKGINNIIFDLGGVLLNIDYQLTSKAFSQVGFLEFDNMYGQYRADQLFEKLETGMISDEDFCTVMRKVSPSQIGDRQVIDAWCAMLLDFRLESLAYLKRLAAEYNLYLLSNTNSIHLQAIDKVFDEQVGVGKLDDYFIKAYYSNRIGRRKPDTSTYEFILKDAQLNAGETLFIDDSYNNLETAAHAGLKTYLLKSGEFIEQLGLLPKQ